MQATAFGIHPNETITTVAVKMVNSTRNTVAIKALVSELKIMIHLGSHLNVVNLLGACTKDVDTGQKQYNSENIRVFYSFTAC